LSRIKKRPGSKYYQYTTGTPPNRVRRSTGQTNHHAAKIKQKEFDELYEQQGLTYLPKTVKHFIDNYLAWHKQNKNPEWNKRVEQGLKPFSQLYHNVLLTDISIDHVIHYKAERTKFRAKNTVNHELSMLSGLFKYAQMRRMILSNPADPYFIERYDTSENRRDPIPIDMIKEVINQTTNDRDKAMMSLALYSGMRAADAGTLKKSNIKDGFLEWKQGKVSKSCVVPMHPNLKDMELTLLAPKKKQRENVTNHLQKMLMELYQYKSDFHSIRHTFSNRLTELDLDWLYIKFLLGHKMDDITWRYMHKKVETFRPYVCAI
tara:strand:+ start:570 stop:1526 length:957 start_codon:yes stop_codon:yes gene_type:complete